jgi:hypothetical protein
MTAPINSGINSWGRVTRVAEAGVLLAFSRLDDRRRSVVAHVSNPGASSVYSGTFRDRGDEHGHQEKLPCKNSAIFAQNIFGPLKF